MAAEKGSDDGFDRLRQRAEKLLSSGQSDQAAPEGIMDIIHELQVHQIELELQNEELRKATEERRELEEKYRRLYEDAPCGYLTLDPSGRVSELNATAVQLFDRNLRLVGQEMASLVAEQSAEPLRDALARSGKTGKTQRLEIARHTSDGAKKWYWAEVAADRRTDESVSQWRVVLLDVTHRRQLQIALENSEKRLRNLAAHLQETTERDLSRYAHEIHDSLAQMLVAAKLSLDVARKHARNENSASAEQIQDAMDLVDQAIAGARKLSAELRPALLDEFGLVEAVRHFLKECEDKTDLTIKASIWPDAIPINREESLAVFRIVQELIANVILHAEANRVDVNMFWDGKAVQLSILDDGIGVTTAQLASPASYGLSGIAERARFLGGSARFSGDGETGTTCTVTIPAASNLPTAG